MSGSEREYRQLRHVSQAMCSVRGNNYKIQVLLYLTPFPNVKTSFIFYVRYNSPL
jgi:hypothetical protein